ncbi:MAG: hypothetical protein ACI82A_002523, partial [Candidatus Azotimanducaceae bacterium]
PIKIMLEFSTVLTSGLFGMNKYNSSGPANPRRGLALFVGCHHVYASQSNSV